MNNFKPRYLELFINHNNPKIQPLLITGARQTGKTTLVKKIFPEIPYVNLDSIEERTRLISVPTNRWAKDIGVAIFDEAQKEPSVFEKIKYAYDAKELPFSILLGSSQILLLKKVRETLAGRIKLYELYPLMMGEVEADGQPLRKPLIDTLINQRDISLVLENVKSILTTSDQLSKSESQQYLLENGGMPALLHIPEYERKHWLRDYELTYLERDLTDLARLSDLEPFRTFQKLAALRSACLLNYSELARDGGISVDTAKRYIEYLKLSYQVELIQPYYRNLTSSVVKTPKLYWLDIGLLRLLSGYYGETNGMIYETFVVSEIIKWIKTSRADVDIYFYRTHHGLELDLLLKTTHGLLGFEIKSRKEIALRDVNVLRILAEKLRTEWQGGIVVYNGTVVKKISEPNIWAVPSSRLFTADD